MKRNRSPIVQSRVLAIALSLALALPLAAAAQVEPQADRLLREMGAYLSSAEEFRFDADVTYDAFSSLGVELQLGGRADISVRRPDRLRVEYEGDERRNRVVYDGERITVYHEGANVYASTEESSGIDDAVDRVFELSGFSVPIADLVYAEPYEVLMESVEAGFVIGRHSVDGTACHHLAFAQETLDWQIWIEVGPRPVPRKLVITYKNEPGAPQYVARLSGWDFNPRLAEAYFEFRPPAGAAGVEFLPSPAPELTELEPEEVER